jgi:hypothetical protein
MAQHKRCFCAAFFKKRLLSSFSQTSPPKETGMGRAARAICLSLFVVWLGTGAAPHLAAKQISLIAPMSGFSLMDPTVPPPPGGRQAYAQTGGRLQWGVGTWGSPGGKLPPFAVLQDGTETIYSSRSLAAGIDVATGPTGTTLTLEQDGRVVPCTHADGKTFESDLFASPNDLNVKAPRRPRLLRAGRSALALSSLKSLVFSTDLVMTEGLAMSRKRCKANFGGVLFAVILNDRESRPFQTFFYQIFLSRLCGTGEPVRLPSCARPLGMFQYFVTNPFGSDDFLPLAGAPLILDGQQMHIRTDLLPRLVAMIRTARGGVDQNLSHWTVGSVYLGQNVFGDATMQSSWRHVSLVATSD